MPAGPPTIIKPRLNEVVNLGSTYKIIIETGMDPAGGETHTLNFYYSTASAATSPFTGSNWILISASYDVLSNYYINPYNGLWQYSASWEVPNSYEGEVYVAAVTSSDLTDFGMISDVFTIGKGYGSGSGIQGDPYIIYTPQELHEMRFFPGEWGFPVYWKLGNDIDLSGWNAVSGSWLPITSGTYWNPASQYAIDMVFDGAGYTISNMLITTSYSSDTVNSIGLFGVVYYTGEATSSDIFYNLTLNSCSIYLLDDGVDFTTSSNMAIGLLAGQFWDYNAIAYYDNYNFLRNVHIKNSSITLIKSDYTASQENYNYLDLGGMVGQFWQGKISSCSVDNVNIYVNISQSDAVTGGSPPAGGTTRIASLAIHPNIVEYSYVSNINITASLSVITDTASLLYKLNKNVGINGLFYSSDGYHLHDNYAYNVNISTPHTASGLSEFIYTDNEIWTPSVYNMYVDVNYQDSNPDNVFVIATEIDWYFSDTDWPLSIYYLSESATSTFVDPNSIPTQNSSFATGTLDAQMQNTASFVGFDFNGVWASEPTFQTGYPYLGWFAPETGSAPTGSDTSSLTLLSPVGGETYNANLGVIIPVSWSYT